MKITISRGTKIKSSNLYYIGLIIYFLAGALSNSMIGLWAPVNALINWADNLGLILMLFSILMGRRWSGSIFVAFCGMVAICMLIYVAMGSKLPLTLIITLIGAQKAEGKNIAKIHLATSGGVVIVSMLAALTGIVENRIFYRGSDGIRNSFGMTYVTIWAAYVFFLLLSYIYLRKDKIRWFDYVIILGSAIFVYKFTYTRIETLFFVILASSLPIYEKIEENRIVKKIMIYIFPICMISIFFLQYLYMSEPAKYAALDDLFTRRFSYTAKVLNEFDFKLFGNAIRMQGYGTVNFDSKYGYFFVDSFYLNYGIRYGIVFMVALSILITAICRVLVNNNLKFEATMVLFTCLHGIIISLILVPYASPCILIAFSEYSKIRQNDKKRIKHRRLKM